VAARRVEEPGHVVGLDINPGMLAVARSLTLPRGSAQIEWCEGSALALPFAEGVFDVVLCQLGLQFVPDRPAAVREMRRVLGRGGHVGASVYAPIDRNPATHALADALDRHLGAGASRAKRHEHSLGDPNELRALFAGAGFEDVRVETVARTVCFASAAEYVRVQLVATPLADMLGEHESADREQILAAVTADVDASLAPFVRDDGLAFPQEVHVALAWRR